MHTIRREMVPRAHLDAAMAALSDRLGKTAVCLPSDEITRMGALANLAQPAEVRARIGELEGDAEIVAGDPQAGRLASGNAESGAYLNPVLFHCARPHRASAVHDLEAFGSVATVMRYDEPEEAVALAAMGKGSLVASLFTDDPSLAEAMVLGLAPFHGRVLIGNRDSAKGSTGHGLPMPGLVNGGFGRAGRGEELGGIRGVKHYMQRTAVQGALRLLSSVTGRWVECAGAATGRSTRSASR